MPQVQIKSDGPGSTKVTVDGVDITARITQLRLEQTAGEPFPTLHLSILVPELVVEGLANVDRTSQPLADPGPPSPSFVAVDEGYEDDLGVEHFPRILQQGPNLLEALSPDTEALDRVSNTVDGLVTRFNSLSDQVDGLDDHLRTLMSQVSMLTERLGDMQRHVRRVDGGEAVQQAIANQVQFERQLERIIRTPHRESAGGNDIG